MKSIPSNDENERKTIRMKKTLVEKIEELARVDNRNFNNMVETLLIKSVQHYESAL